MHANSQEPLSTTHDALAIAFADVHRARLRYVAEWKRWMAWDGMRWRPDRTLLAAEQARAVCGREAACVRADEAPEVATRVAHRLSNAATPAAVERLARGDRALAAEPGQWDLDPDLLNTPGGVVDTVTGEMRPHRVESYMTRIAAVAPAAPGTLHPVWSQFLDRIAGGDADLVFYLQRLAGYALTGHNTEHALCIRPYCAGRSMARWLGGGSVSIRRRPCAKRASAISPPRTRSHSGSTAAPSHRRHRQPGRPRRRSTPAGKPGAAPTARPPAATSVSARRSKPAASCRNAGTAASAVLPASPCATRPRCRPSPCMRTPTRHGKRYCRAFVPRKANARGRMRSTRHHASPPPKPRPVQPGKTANHRHGNSGGRLVSRTRACRRAMPKSRHHPSPRRIPRAAGDVSPMPPPACRPCLRSTHKATANGNRSLRSARSFRRVTTRHQPWPSRQGETVLATRARCCHHPSDPSDPSDRAAGRSPVPTCFHHGRRDRIWPRLRLRFLVRQAERPTDHPVGTRLASGNR